LTTNISGVGEAIKSGKRHYQLLFLPHWTKKLGELWSTNHKAMFANFDSPKINSAHVFRQL